MVELIGDICMPSSLIIPSGYGKFVGGISGALILSGAKLKFYTGSAWETITSS